MTIKWEQLQDIRIEVQSGGAMCYNHNRYSLGEEQDSLYVFVGGGSRELWYYSTSQGVWNTEEEPTPHEQWGGSSITSGRSRPGRSQYLYAIFGASDDGHWILRLRPGWNAHWRFGDNLPGWISQGCAITCDPAVDWAYLLMDYFPPEYNTNFFLNRAPWSDEDETEGSQSVVILPTIQKPKISYHQDRIEIRYTTDTHGRVSIKVYDLLGKPVKTLLADNIEKGEHRILWDKTDNSLRKIPCGIYFITIDNEGKPERVKVVIR
jgi:hypothetical protein